MVSHVTGITCLFVVIMSDDVKRILSLPESAQCYALWDMLSAWSPEVTGMLDASFEAFLKSTFFVTKNPQFKIAPTTGDLDEVKQKIVRLSGERSPGGSIDYHFIFFNNIIDLKLVTNLNRNGTIF